MHIKMDHPEDRFLPLKWRGAALSEFDGRTWFNPSVVAPDAAAGSGRTAGSGTGAAAPAPAFGTFPMRSTWAI